MLTAEMKDKICALVEDVEYKVAKGLSEEIRRLAVLVRLNFLSSFSSFILASSPLLSSTLLLLCGFNSSPLSMIPGGRV